MAEGTSPAARWLSPERICRRNSCWASIVDLWLAEVNRSGRAEMSKQRQKEQKGTKMGDSKWHGVDANNPFALPDQGSCIDKILTEETRPGLEGPWHLSGKKSWTGRAGAQAIIGGDHRRRS